MKNNAQQKYQFFNFQQKQNIQAIQDWLRATDRFRPLVLRGIEEVGREYLLNAACYQEELAQRPFTVFTIDNNQVSDDVQTTVQHIENKYSFDEKENSLWKELTSLVPDVANIEDDFYGTTITLNLAVTTKLLKVFANHFQTKKLKATVSDSQQQLQDSIELATQKTNLVVHIKNIETSIHTLSMWQDIAHTLDEAARESGKKGRVLLAFSLDEYAPYAGILQRERKDLRLIELAPYTFSSLKQMLNKQFINNDFSKSFLGLLLWQGAMDENSLHITSSQLFTVFFKLYEEELLYQSDTGWTIDDESPANINKVLGMPLRKHYEARLETIPEDLKPAINEFMYLATLCGQWIPQHPILEAIGIESQDQQDDILDAIEVAFIEIDKPILEDHAFSHSGFPDLAIFQLNYPLLNITASRQFSYDAEEKQEKVEDLLKHLHKKLKLELQIVADLFWRIAQHASRETKQVWKEQLDWYIHPHAMPYFQQWLYQKYKSDRDYAALLLQAASEPLSPTTDKYLDLIVSVAEKHYQQTQEGYPLTQAMADSLHEVGEKYIDLGIYSKAEAFLEAALEIKQVISKDINIAYTLNSLSAVYSTQSEYKKALEYEKQALAIGKKILSENHPNIATSLNNMGSNYSHLGNKKKALVYLKQALTIREKVLHEGHPDIAKSLNNIGSNYRNLENPEKALEYHKQALTIREKALFENHPDIATSLNNIGLSYHDLGNPEKALEYHKQAFAIREKVLPERHPDIANNLNHIGLSYSSLRNPEKALKYHKQELTIREKALFENHPDIATSLNNIGLSYHDLGNPEKALEYHKQAFAIREKVLPERHPDIANNLNHIGLSYSSLRNPEKALKYHKQELTIREKVLHESHPKIAIILNNIGSIYHRLGNPEKALEYEKKALAILKKVLPEDHFIIAIIFNNIADSYSSLNKFKKALKFYKKSWLIYNQNLAKEHASNITTTLQNISKMYEKLNKPKKALEYREILSEI